MSWMRCIVLNYLHQLWFLAKFVKTCKMKYTTIILILALFSITGYSQEMGYNIFGTNGKAIQEEKLDEALTMTDINPDYPSSWIKESDYISSEIKATCKGKLLNAKGENDVFNSEQKNILQEADFGTSIDIEVKYNSKNSITGTVDIKTMNFTVSLVPDKEAVYQGGYDEMKDYLKQNAVDKINASSHNKFEMAKVKFIVDEEGKTTMARILKTSEDKEIDQLLLETIANMPRWKPAERSDGVKVKQEFEFVVGTMMGC